MNIEVEAKLAKIKSNPEFVSDLQAGRLWVVRIDGVYKPCLSLKCACQMIVRVINSERAPDDEFRTKPLNIILTYARTGRLPNYIDSERFGIYKTYITPIKKL